MLGPGERRPLTFVLEVSGLEERVTVTAEPRSQPGENPPVYQAPAPPPAPKSPPRPARPEGPSPGTSPSSNVFSLQQRVSGVLPVRVDVPRSGKSYVFVRPLVIEEETVLRFKYRQ